MKFKTVKKVGEFKDFTGATRQYVMVAVSVPEDEFEFKHVSIGVSVCRPGDTFDPVLGERIATGKALSIKGDTHMLSATDPGMINSVVVNSLLEQESTYFQQHPERYINGYLKDKQKYDANKTKAVSK